MTDNDDQHDVLNAYPMVHTYPLMVDATKLTVQSKSTCFTQITSWLAYDDGSGLPMVALKSDKKTNVPHAVVHFDFFWTSRPRCERLDYQHTTAHTAVLPRVLQLSDNIIKSCNIHIKKIFTNALGNS